MSRSTKKGPYVEASLMKKVEAMNANGEKIAIFWTMDTHEGYGTAFRLLEMGQYSQGNPSVILQMTVGIYKRMIGFLFKLGERQLDNKRQLMSIQIVNYCQFEDYILFSYKKVFVCLHMCIFCRTFVQKNEIGAAND